MSSFMGPTAVNPPIVSNLHTPNSDSAIRARTRALFLLVVQGGGPLARQYGPSYDNRYCLDIANENARYKSEFPSISMQELISPVLARLEVYETLHEEYERMDVLYQVSLCQDPSNLLLLCNYAQVLCHVTRNYNWAGELFRLTIQTEQADANVFCRYTDFLWMVRKDSWVAKEQYQQAIVMDPNNPHYATKYTNFLWSTGGDETCFPLDAPNDWYINPELSKSDELT